MGSSGHFAPAATIPARIMLQVVDFCRLAYVLCKTFWAHKQRRGSHEPSGGQHRPGTVLISTQVSQGLDGRFTAVCSGLGTQAFVPRANVAIVIAVVLLWIEIGAGVGDRISANPCSGAERPPTRPLPPHAELIL